MATMKERARYVTGLAGAADKLGKELESRDERARQLDELVGSGMDNVRDELREAMNFSVERRDGKGVVKSQDERGQRKSIETEDARTKYKSIDPATAQKLYKALDIVKQKKDAMKKAGFSTTEIIDELFTPLIREGLLVDTLVLDEYSEVATLLREVRESYRGMLKQQQEEKRLAGAKGLADYHNAGTKVDRLAGLGSKLGGFAESQVGALASKVGFTPEELKRAGALTGKSLSTVGSVGSAVSSGMKLDKAIGGDTSTQKTSTKLEGMSVDISVSPAFTKIADELGKVVRIAPVQLQEVMDGLRIELAHAGYRLDDWLNNRADALLSTLVKFAKLMESNGVAITKDVADVLIAGIGEGIGIGGASAGRVEASTDLDLAVRRGELRSGVRDLALSLHGVLQSQALATTADVAVSEAIAGAFSSAFDIDALVDYLTPALPANTKTDRPDGATAVAKIAQALQSALADADDALKPAGKALAEKFSSGASGEITRLGKLFKTGDLPDPEGCLKPLVAVAEKAAGEVFAGDLFKNAVAGDSVRSAMAEKARQANVALENDLEAVNAEMEDFERQLVLIDEGGMEAARQQSLDALIAQHKADEMDLEIVLKAGSLLSGVGGAVTKLGTDSRTVAIGQNITDQGVTVAKNVGTQVAGSLVPALQAAQLVMKMSVTIVRIYRRGQLLSKFKSDVAKAKKAGSALLPSIENFFSAKVFQQTHASIELALQTVQLAGAICSSVPEPITMAVGKALTASAQAGEAARDLTKTAQDEAALRKGWKVTLQALNNPANRRLGLEALRRNSTMAVHSVAWAASQGDPMAKEIMRSVGADAQTLADDGSTKDKMIEYLETRLSEDLQFKDADKIKINWMPDPLQLGFVGWFTLKKRGLKAVPALRDDATAEIDAALKKLDLRPPIHQLLAGKVVLQATEITAYQTEAKAARDLLDKHKPAAQDGSAHGDMLAACKKMAGLADDLLENLTLVAARSAPQTVQV